MITNTACVREVQEPTRHIPKESQGVSPQDILNEFSSGGINSEEALAKLIRLGMFAGNNLDETLRALLHGIEAQDGRAALAEYPPSFLDCIFKQSKKLVAVGRVTAECGQKLAILLKG
jgi:hypothetical protein